MMADSSLVLGVVEDSDEDFAALSRVFSLRAPEVVLQRWTRAEPALEQLRDRARSQSAGDPWPQMLIVDLSLPGVDGSELVRRLRAESTTHSLPAVILSGSGRQNDVDRCYEAGANGYLVKPSTSAEFGSLIATLMCWLRRSLQPSAPWERTS
jgi:CheY-like chemotaxis protein